MIFALVDPNWKVHARGSLKDCREAGRNIVIGRDQHGFEIYAIGIVTGRDEHGDIHERATDDIQTPRTPNDRMKWPGELPVWRIVPAWQLKNFKLRSKGYGRSI